MPQVDLESLACGGVGGICGDSKVACETTLIHSQPESEPDPDLPAESFRIPISGGNLEYWLNNINPVYDRDDSTKGTTNPKSHLQHNHQQQQAGPIVNSQRFSGNLKATAKAPIIALPNKIHHHSGYLGQTARKPHHPPIFPKKTVRVSDPGSPKVSWFGKVLSEKDKCRRRSPEAGCWAVFRCLGRRRKEEAAVAEEEGGGGLRSEGNRNAPVRDVKAPPGEPPGLGGMKRFASGRRAESWGGDAEAELEMEEGHVAWSGPLDRR